MDRIHDQTADEYFAIIPRSLLRDPMISPGAKLVYAVLADHANREDHAAWPSVATIGKYLGIAKRDNVRKYIDQIVESGWISREIRPRAKGEQHLPNLYVVRQKGGGPGNGTTVAPKTDPRVAPETGHEVEPGEGEPLKTTNRAICVDCGNPVTLNPDTGQPNPQCKTCYKRQPKRGPRHTYAGSEPVGPAYELYEPDSTISPSFAMPDDLRKTQR